MKRYILVTGCAGFIGSSFIKSLNNRFNIIGIDDLSNGTKKSLPRRKNFIFIKGDCADKNILKKINYKVDYVYHFAGQSSGEKSFYDPMNDTKKNYYTTVSLLDFCLRKRVKQFIYASSMAVYGNKYSKSVDEKKLCDPISFYGASKYASEQYIKLFSKKKINFTILRFFNVYGPGQKLGNLQQGLIRIYLTQILKSKKLVVKGSLKRFRDFMYIDDVTNLLKRILNNKKAFNEIFNVGYGKKIFLYQLLEIIKKNIKLNFKLKLQKGTPLDQFGIYSNSNKLKRLSFVPKVNLHMGIKKFLESI